MVCLVEDRHLDGVEGEGLLLQQVFETPRAGDDDVDTTVERRDLALGRDAAVDHRRDQTRCPGDRGDGRVDLLRELAGGAQHEAAGPTDRLLRARRRETRDEREREGERLARAGPSAAEHVAAREGVRERRDLDREGAVQALARQLVAHGDGQGEVVEARHVRVPLAPAPEQDARRPARPGWCSGIGRTLVPLKTYRAHHAVPAGDEVVDDVGQVPREHLVGGRAEARWS